VNNTDLWNAINSYVVACGGSPAPRVYGHRARQITKAEIEKRLDEITDSATKEISEAARALLEASGEMDDGKHLWLRRDANISSQWRALHALVGGK